MNEDAQMVAMACDGKPRSQKTNGGGEMGNGNGKNGLGIKIFAGVASSLIVFSCVAAVSFTYGLDDRIDSHEVRLSVTEKQFTYFQEVTERRLKNLDEKMDEVLNELRRRENR